MRRGPQVTESECVYIFQREFLLIFDVFVFKKECSLLSFWWGPPQRPHSCRVGLTVCYCSKGMQISIAVLITGADSGYSSDLGSISSSKILTFAKYFISFDIAVRSYLCFSTAFMSHIDRRFIVSETQFKLLPFRYFASKMSHPGNDQLIMQ